MSESSVKTDKQRIALLERRLAKLQRDFAKLLARYEDNLRHERRARELEWYI